MLKRRDALVSALALGIFSPCVRADQVQFTLPYNVDVIREPGGTASGLGAHGEAYVTQSYAAANDSVTPRGLPDSGLIKDVRLGPYNGNNAVIVGSNQYVLLGRFPPRAFLDLHVYVAADDGFGSFPHESIKLAINKPHTVNYEQQPVNNWLTDGDFIGGLDTTGPSGAGFIDANSAGIQDIRFFVDNRDQSINSLEITGVPASPNGSANLYVFAAQAIFPEPGTAMSAALAALLLSRRRR